MLRPEGRKHHKRAEKAADWRPLGHGVAERLGKFWRHERQTTGRFPSRAKKRLESPSTAPVTGPSTTPAGHVQKAVDLPSGADEQRANAWRTPSILSSLLVIVLLALCPALVAHGVNDFLQYGERRQAVRNAALETAELRNSELEIIISNIDRLLGNVARIPEISSQDPLACDALTKLLVGSPNVVLAIADRDGHIGCATIPVSAPVEVGDRDFIQSTIAQKMFTVGGYVRSRLDGEPKLAFATPIIRNDGEIVGIALAYLNLDWLASTMERARLLPGENLVITDQQGIVLAHLPGGQANVVGDIIPAKYLTALRAPKPGVFDMDDFEGRPAIFAFIPITVPPPNIYVLFSVQKDIAFGGIAAAGKRALTLSAVSVALGLFLAWLVAVKYVRDPVRQLLTLSRQWREGNYSARAATIGGCAELRQLGEQFNGMADAVQLRDDQLSAANRAQELTLATAGHDLRQPVQILSSVIDLLSREEMSDRERRYIRAAKSSICTLVGGLDALIETIRLHGEALGSRQEVLPIGDILEELTSQWHGKAIEKGLRFRIRACDKLIISNRRMVATVLHNFVANAIKYTRSGGVLVGCRIRTKSLWIEVYDTGAGIAQEKLEIAFREFQQLDPTQEGFGLGLWIARQTVLALGHELVVRSTVGTGSRFRLIVPLGATPDGNRHSPEIINDQLRPVPMTRD